jgi:hypothetical protein
VNHWPFIIGAYALTIVGSAAMLVGSYAAMRRSERDAEAMRRDR